MKLTAFKSNDYSNDYYDHNIICPNEDIFLNDDPFANPQLTEKFFIKTPYVFTMNTFDKKYDNVISTALRDIHAYESFLNKFYQFSLTFHFLTPKERDLHCSHVVMLRKKQTHTYTYCKFIQHHYTLKNTAGQFHIRYQYINSKYTSPFFLNFTYCIKDITYKASSELTIPSPRCIYILSPNQTPQCRRSPPTYRPTRIPPAR